MKLVKEVSTLEVKRCFAISDLTKPPQGARLTSTTFKKHFEKAKKRVLAMNDARLDDYVHGPRKRKYIHDRLESYDNSDWYLVEVSIKDIGVWRRAGNLPLEWTNGSLQETAEHVEKAFNNGLRRLPKRARSAIPHILETNVHSLQKNPYLLPIGFADRTGTWPRKYLRHRTAVALDDGNMRSIALAISGAKKIRVYYGVPKKKSR